MFLHVSLSVSPTQADWLTFQIYLFTYKKQTSDFYYNSVKYLKKIPEIVIILIKNDTKKSAMSCELSNSFD